MEIARIYRNYTKSYEYKFNITYKESDLFIICDRNLKKEAFSALFKYRNIIENHIKLFPEFLTSLKPLKIPDDKSPDIIKEMYIASQKANVGPFASVAGAISEFVGKDLKKKCNEILIENGGDLYLNGKKDRIVAIWTLRNFKLGLKVKGENLPLSICSSSSKIGHSLSFGNADLVTVISKNGAYSDALATSICNRIKNCKDINEVLREIKINETLKGVIIIYKNKIGFKGKLDFIKLN